MHIGKKVFSRFRIDLISNNQSSDRYKISNLPNFFIHPPIILL